MAARTATFQLYGRLRAQEGIAAGVLAGLGLGLAELFTVALLRIRDWATFRRPPTGPTYVLGGRSPLAALADTIVRAVEFASSALVGITVHFAFAILYGVIAARLLKSPFGRSLRITGLFGFGLLYGALVWAMNFVLIDAVLLPGLMTRLLPAATAFSPTVEILLYALFYGVPLAVALGALDHFRLPIELRLRGSSTR